MLLAVLVCVHSLRWSEAIPLQREPFRRIALHIYEICNEQRRYLRFTAKHIGTTNPLSRVNYGQTLSFIVTFLIYVPSIIIHSSAEIDTNLYRTSSSFFFLSKYILTIRKRYYECIFERREVVQFIHIEGERVGSVIHRYAYTFLVYIYPCYSFHRGNR